MAETLRSYLNKKLRVTVSDGRVLLGKLLCTDRDRNLVVSSCLEYMANHPPADLGVKHQPRLVGMATIPGQHIVKIEVREDDDGEEDAFPVSLLQPDSEKDSQGKEGVNQGNEQPLGTCTNSKDNSDITGDTDVIATVES